MLSGIFLFFDQKSRNEEPKEKFFKYKKSNSGFPILSMQ